MNKFNIGQRVVTDFGIGNVLMIEGKQYKVFIDFPSTNQGPYEDWIDENNIRYAFDTADDYRRIPPETDNRVTRTVKTPKERKQKTVWRHGRYTQVWR